MAKWECGYCGFATEAASHREADAAHSRTIPECPLAEIIPPPKDPLLRYVATRAAPEGLE